MTPHARNKITFCLLLVISGCSQDVLNEKDHRYLQFVKPLPGKDQNSALQPMPDAPASMRKSMTMPATASVPHDPALMKKPMSVLPTYDTPEAPGPMKESMPTPVTSNTNITKQRMALPNVPVDPNLVIKPVLSNISWPPTSGLLPHDTPSNINLTRESILTLVNNSAIPDIEPTDELVPLPAHEEHLDVHVNESTLPNTLPLPPSVRKSIHKVNKQIRQLHLENQRLKDIVANIQQEIVKQSVSLQHFQHVPAPRDQSSQSTLVKIEDVYLTIYICAASATSTALLVMLILTCLKLLPSTPQ